MPSIGPKLDIRIGRETELVRSGPIYVETPHGIATLVKEGPAPAGNAGKVTPTAVYIIDEQGVRRISLVRSKRKQFTGALLLLLLVFALYRFFHGKN